ncbi:DUF5819 family protein [Streptomyces sp. TRM49041]|uniref:DUF5819 family protein n=1 Tax=Streptomyces sp. TRM49041 TaxID=2603216 RepID=UPI0011ECB566|nr:DUF5819 family protein [Streptomyces sp. TRM49041]
MSNADHECSENEKPPGILVIAPPPETEPVSGGGASPPSLSLPAELTVAFATVLCVLAALTHVCLVFLYVAPSNTVSQRYGKQIDAWIYPYFEQNWQLFAPNPESVRWRISARSAAVAPDGSRQVGEWLDLTAVDAAAVRHTPFPSHTAQNMLRRAWAVYDQQSTSERGRMLQEYLANIAAERLAVAGTQPRFEAVQLRVVRTPIAPPGSSAPTNVSSGGALSSARYLPWWQVDSHDR